MHDSWATRDTAPRLAETALARLAMALGKPLGGLPARIPLDVMMAFLKRRHPGLFERLEELGDAEVLVDPIDMPACLAMRLGTNPRLRLVERGTHEAAGTIRGTFAVLLDLLEGRIDGDALFFSRDLVIEGDTEVVVALRNAVDAEEMNLEADLQAALGPLGRFVPSARGQLTRLLEFVGRTRAHVLGTDPARLSQGL
ncbi:MAG TPA: SCP2 sterol-binding domain-containing protein [Azospirillaceae bacterium]|nr:SCP2 sterol-binding domain-containing protein [Azospirillaceae bacterium]